MDLNDLLYRYFGTSDPSELTTSAQTAGVDRLTVELGLETEPSQRFALWSLLYMLGHAPDLDVVFDTEDGRKAARNLMDMLAAGDES